MISVLQCWKMKRGYTQSNAQSSDDYKKLVSGKYQSACHVMQTLAAHLPDMHSQERAHFALASKADHWDPWKKIYYELIDLELVASTQEDWNSLLGYMSSTSEAYQGSVSLSEKLSEFVVFFPIISLVKVYHSPRNLLMDYLRFGIVSPFRMMQNIPPDLRPPLRLRFPQDISFIDNLEQYGFSANLETLAGAVSPEYILEIYTRSLCRDGRICPERAEVFAALAAEARLLTNDSRKSAITNAVYDAYMHCLARGDGVVPAAVQDLVLNFAPETLSQQLLLGQGPKDERVLSRTISWAASPAECLLCALVVGDWDSATVAAAESSLPQSLLPTIFFKALTPAVYQYSESIDVYWNIPKLFSNLPAHSHDWRTRLPSDSLEVLLSHGNQYIRDNIFSVAPVVIKAFPSDCKNVIRLFLDQGLTHTHILGTSAISCRSASSFLWWKIRVPLSQLPQLEDDLAVDVLASALYTLEEKVALIRICRTPLTEKYLARAIERHFSSEDDLKMINDALRSNLDS